MMSHRKEIPNSSLGAAKKFMPSIGFEIITKNGTTKLVETRHQCITYENKSFEELRHEHYRLAERSSDWSPDNITTHPNIPYALNPVVILNPAPRFRSPVITTTIAFSNPSNISSSINSTSTNKFPNPMAPSILQYTTVPSTSSAAIYSSTNNTTAAFKSASSSTADLSFPKLPNTTSVFTRASNPEFSSSCHKYCAFTCRRAPSPPATFSNSTTSSSTFSTSEATALNFTTTTNAASTFRNSSTPAYTFSAPTIISTNTTSTNGRLGTHSPDVNPFSNFTSFSKENTITAGTIEYHSPAEFIFPNPTTDLFSNTTTSSVIFSSAGTPVFSTSNQKCSTFTVQSLANPSAAPFRSSRSTTSSSTFSRSAATALNFTTTTNAASTFRNSSTPEYTFSTPTFISTNTTSTNGRHGTHSPDVNPFSKVTFFPKENTITAGPIEYHSPGEFIFPNPTTALFSNTTTTTVTFSNAGTPVFSTSNQKSSTLTVQSLANPPATPFRSTAFTSPEPPTTGYRVPRFSFIGASAVTSSNSTNPFVNTGNTTSRELMLSAPQTSESHSCQTACWNPQSHESVISPSTNLPQCGICADKERDIAFVPCGHLLVCSTCVNQIGRLCPMCRRFIRKKIKVYIS